MRNEAKRESGWLGMIRDDTGAGLASHMKCFSLLLLHCDFNFLALLLSDSYFRHSDGCMRWLGLEGWRTEELSAVPV